MEEVNYMGNFSRNFNKNPYSNIFNQRWRNHLNFGWRDQQNPQQGFNNNRNGMYQNQFNNKPFETSQQQLETPRQSLSDLAGIVSNLSKTTHSFVTETKSSIRNLEIQIGQLSKRIPEIPSNTLPNNTEGNPKEECKALTIEVVTEPKKEHVLEELKEIIAHEETKTATLHAPLLREESEEYSSSEEDEESKKKQFARYLTILRKLKANSSPTEALEEEDEPVILAKECSALVQKKLPQKLSDPGSFLIPCTIGTITFEKALYDLGSSINLMPLSVMKRLGILEVQRATISLKLADKTQKRAYGMVEDVLVKVDDLHIPADFVILDTGEDRDESIILGWPFLATPKAIIDVERGELVLRLHEDCILFKIPTLRLPLTELVL
ncbi:uncharacterized protein PFB0145c-like [Arachis ipaensis]|uniref:uncharacterized protein PFB0145c-like n=1 Tax=Arachis ipaensis TaxID=130454 RepID=UPI0007AFC975|nr:uncharacterized protein PFB0145c-like [Arachis ipaensis]XP_025685257.1 uncharacterized protein PFB0145c-like [Arachis hypogaea]